MSTAPNRPVSSLFFTGRAGHRSLAALATVGVLLLSACASSTRLEPAAPVEDRSQSAGSAAAGAGASGANASGVGGSGASANALGGNRVATIDLGRADDGAGGANGLPKVVYFDFDSFVVADTYRNVIEANARFLNADRRRRVIIEGHTDERGGREYNLALGQKRADAVARALSLLGVQDAQAEAVSYGEERPAVSGSDEAAMAKNRRAELKAR